MNSCLYECRVMHCRVRPKRHQFTHTTFMFYLDLDEIDTLAKSIPFFSHNRRNIYEFRDADHFEPDSRPIKEKVRDFIRRKGVDMLQGRIMLLTNVRTFGHIFNPVSFYFCFDAQHQPFCAVVEIGNTFGEIKPFYVGPEQFKDGKFISQQKKFFYISPFVDMDIPLDFQIRVPDDKLNIQIDDFDAEGKFLYTTLTGPRRPLTLGQLIQYTFTIPFVTLKVIGLIHWHALLLWLKKVPHHAKENHPELQKHLLREWKKL